MACTVCSGRLGAALLTMNIRNAMNTGNTVFLWRRRRKQAWLVILQYKKRERSEAKNQGLRV